MPLRHIAMINRGKLACAQACLLANSAYAQLRIIKGAWKKPAYDRMALQVCVPTEDYLTGTPLKHKIDVQVVNTNVG